MGQYMTIESGVPLAIAMRLVDLDGVAYDRDDVSAIAYTVDLLGETDETEETAVTASTSLTVTDVMPASVTNPESWTEDNTGYNFRHFLSTTPFTLTGRVYKVMYTFTVSGVAIEAELYVTTSRSRISSGYCMQRDIEQIFGPSNVAKWADIENGGNASDIGGRIAAAIDAAKNEIDDRLRGGPYLVPFTTIPDTINYIAAQLAGVWLYESRGIEDFDENTGQAIHRLSWYRKNADQTLTKILQGQRRLDATAAGTTPNNRAPVVIPQS